MESSFRQRDNRRSSGVGRLLLDFANILKAFIGTNYLGAAFQFKQSGLVLGIIGVILIASATVHCCNLIVRCKQLAIRKILGYQDFQNSVIVEDVETEAHLQLRKQVEKQVSYGDIAWIAAGKWGIALINFGLVVTQFGFCVGYFIFLGNTLHMLFPLVKGTVPTPSPVTTTPSTNHTPTVHTTEMYNDNIGGLTDELTISLSPNITNITILEPSYHYSGPVSMYYILVASLVPLFVAFAFLRNIKHMGPASLVANISCFIGYAAVMGYILSDFHVSDTVELFQWKTFPIFFGGVTGGYEGIGCIIPIESSMDKNRKHFPVLLYSAVITFTFILVSLSIPGYLLFGEDIQQVIVWNLPSDSILPILVNSVICIGVIFTFPLQNFVVIEILEELIFADGKCCGPQKTLEVDARVQNETSPLLKGHHNEDGDMDLSRILRVATPISDSVPTWKRNILRVLIVFGEAAIALIFKDDFAYFGAFIGAVGSTLLAYIIPCFLHIKLKGSCISWPVYIKDIAIILFGIIGGVASVYASVVAIINNFQ